jgi:cytochrome P450 family 6
VKTPYFKYTSSISGKGFGLIAVKIALANVLANFEVSTCAETPKRLQFNPKAMILAARGGIHLKFTKLIH